MVMVNDLGSSSTLRIVAGTAPAQANNSSAGCSIPLRMSSQSSLTGFQFSTLRALEQS